MLVENALNPLKWSTICNLMTFEIIYELYVYTFNTETHLSVEEVDII